MLEESGFFPLNFLSYKGIQTGDHKGMRYRMLREGEKPDFQIHAWVWPEPLGFEATPEEKKRDAFFPFTEDGRKEAIAWFREQYESRREEWENAPSLLAAMQ